MVNLKILGISEFLNEVVVYVLVFYINCSFSRNWYEIFDFLRSFFVERFEWIFGSIVICKYKVNGEEEIKVRMILYLELCGIRFRMLIFEY